MDTGKPTDKATNKRYGILRIIYHSFRSDHIKELKCLAHNVSSVLGIQRTSEGPVLPEKVIGKDKGSVTGRAGSLPVASPPDQEENSSDLGLDCKPKKGIIFEICSEDGFHVRCESIEGKRQ